MEAISSGWPMRPSGVCAMAAFSKSDPMKPPLWVPSVSTTPGLRVLTRIFFGPSSDALQQVEANFEGRRFLFRSQLTADASQAVRATGVAIPPTLRELQ
jgi:hypothetical protein